MTDKGFQLIQYLVKSGYVWNTGFHDVAPFVKKLCKTREEAALVLNTLYRSEHLIGIDKDVWLFAALHTGDGSPEIGDIQIRLHAKSKAVDIVNKARDHRQIVLLTRTGIAVGVIGVIATLLGPSSSNPEQSQAPTADTIPTAKQIPDTPAPMPIRESVWATCGPCPAGSAQGAKP